jgi:dienelactone hydrolase
MKIPHLSAVMFAFGLNLSLSPCFADGPADNRAEEVRPIPPPGIEVPAEQAASLRAGLETLEKAIDGLRAQKEHAERIAGYLPDVEIFHKAVHDALEYGEFFDPKEIPFAEDALRRGLERAAQLKSGATPWTRQTGRVVRAYRSRIDGSVQPYGLEIPDGHDFGLAHPSRLDFWFHGRGEKLSELSFVQQRSANRKGQASPAGGIVLHPYGRYSNANKFAGEVDTFEALEHARRDYGIDEDRIFVRGFSMGGAACWQFAVHHAGLWAGAQPGAGFSETPDFLKTFQGETLNPAWWEEKLWRWYDATHWAVNLSNTPTIAYSGDKDRQKQAADMMVAASEKAGLRLVHLIGPDTAHAMHPDTGAEIESRLESIARRGRDTAPRTVRFVTHTLRYDRMHWVRIDSMNEHWEPAQVEATWEWPARVTVKTSGVGAFSLMFPAGDCPLDPLAKPEVIIDGVSLKPEGVWTDRSWEVSFHRSGDGNWNLGAAKVDGLTKRAGLQGPIDDAFMDSFLMVAPTGKARHDQVGAWSASEMDRAISHWRKHFRGVARVKKDTEVTDEDIAAHHLILWGDPESNAVLKKIAGQLPIRWESDRIVAGDREFDAKTHAVAMIYPNPLNAKRYVVLNSGFTFREYDYLNNARQTPKLPDWAVIDLSQPATSRHPGGLPYAGFFGEKWEWKKTPAN